MCLKIVLLRQGEYQLIRQLKMRTKRNIGTKNLWNSNILLRKKNIALIPELF